MTPDTVETRVGTLKFVDGVPTTETTQKVYDNLDFLRGVEVFLNFIPAASIALLGTAAGSARQSASREAGPPSPPPQSNTQCSPYRCTYGRATVGTETL